jgi:DNA topoisomerase-1
MGYSVANTMRAAQKLYEAGKITYMRTDSLNLSDLAIEGAVKEIEKSYGKEFVEVRRYKTKDKGAQEAHEAIRPTDFSVRTAGKDAGESRLYDLIWKRAIASQMADAKIEKTTALITISTTKEELKAQGEVVVFAGFLDVYFEGSDDENEANPLEKKMLPKINVGQELSLMEMTGKETFSRPPARYTEASLVKKMEEEGIGRPSTYAPTISTIQNRKYIEKTDKEGVEREAKVLTLTQNRIKESSKTEIIGTEKSKLFPTDLGEVVTDFLVKFFPKIVDYGFTRKVEEDFDKVAMGKIVWNEMIKEFYNPFHKTIEESAGISRDSAMQVRELGIDPKTKKPIIARIGRFGPMIQIGTKDDKEKPKFASIPEGKSIKTVTLEEALELFSLPRLVGKTTDGEEMMSNFGRFGPYVKVGKLFVSIKPEDPLTITEERARELVSEKQEKEKNKYIQVWEKEEIQLLRGPYGIYIKAGKRNVKIPKTVEDPAKLTLEECQKIVKDTPIMKKRKFARKK